MTVWKQDSQFIVPIDEDLALIYIWNNPQELFVKKNRQIWTSLATKISSSLCVTLEEETEGKIMPLKTGLQSFGPAGSPGTPLPRFLPATPFDVYYTKLNSPYPKHSSLT